MVFLVCFQGIHNIISKRESCVVCVLHCPGTVYVVSNQSLKFAQLPIFYLADILNFWKQCADNLFLK